MEKRSQYSLANINREKTKARGGADEPDKSVEVRREKNAEHQTKDGATPRDKKGKKVIRQSL